MHYWSFVAWGMMLLPISWGRDIIKRNGKSRNLLTETVLYSGVEFLIAAYLMYAGFILW